MTAPRDWLTLTIQPAPRHTELGAAAADAGVRPFTADDAEPLARLMLESYRGSVDDSGETLDDARQAVAALIKGEFGTVDWSASVLVEREGVIASATIVTRDRVAPPPLTAGEAFLAFSMTAPAWKRQGLARAGLTHVIELLRQRGEPRLHLVVTRTNTPAVALYRTLGFQNGPLASPTSIA
jgi:ribosomal protein S18 acetylase RimI-like enzyme